MPCPACGLLIVFDDATRTIRHQKPDCAEYTRRMAMAGMTARSEQWQAAVVPATGAVVDVAVTTFESPGARHMREYEQGTRHVYTIPDSPCPGCGARMDHASEHQGPKAPEPGDAGVCVACGTLTVLDEQLGKRRMTEKDLAEFDPEQQRELKEVSAIYRGRALVRPTPGQA